MKNLILFFTVLFLVSCSKDEPVTILPVIKEGVCLSELKAGQVSEYLSYLTYCNDVEGEFHYTGNKLTLTIIERDGKLFAQEDIYYDHLDTTFTQDYEVYNEDQFIVIPERAASALFFFYDNDRINLSPESRIDLDQKGCQIFHSDNIFEGNDIGVLETFKIGDILEDNMTLVSCEPLVDIEAYLMYNDNALVASHTIAGLSLNPQISGWILQK